MPLTPINNPVLALSLPELTTASVAHAETFNPISQTLLNNDAALSNSIKAVDDKAVQQAARIDGLEASSAVSVRKAVGLGWTYGGNAILFELFDPAYTLIDLAPVSVVQGIKYDDSLDVADTSKLKVGEYYLLTDPTAVDGDGVVAPLTIMVQIAAILSGARVRLAVNLAQAWGVSASLARSTMTIQGASAATVVPGDMYLTRSINIGTDAEGGALVIRRSLNSGVATLYYRDAYQLTWKAAGWSLRRTGGDIPAGYADYEYVLPMRGEGFLRLDFSGEPMSIQHMVALGSPTGLGGFVNPEQRPAAPVNSSPTNAQTSVPERPTLAIAGYSSPVGNAQGAVQFQLATVNTFAQILLDTGSLPPALSYSVLAGVLAVNKIHYWRSRVMDVGGLWSDWSTVFSFTTAVTYAYVVAPSITGPAPNATDVPEQPTLSCSTFTVVGSAQTHSASQWRIRAQGGTYAAPVWDSGATFDKVWTVVPAGKLQAGQSGYYVQMRQQGSVTSWSEWSPEVKFTTKAQFANVIGIALLATGGGSGTWSRIDDGGVAKVTDAAFFSSHPIYGAIQDVTIDGQAMVKIPAFYVKAGAIAAGPNAGKRAWWVADQPLAGFVLHPAFMEAGAAIPQFWVSKYPGSSGDSARMDSKPGVKPLGNIDFTAMKARATNRNIQGVVGYSMWSYYQLQAIQLLTLIEMGGADSQALIGAGHTSNSPVNIQNVDQSVVATATWRGIVGLWGNVFQMVDGLQVDATGKFKIWDKAGYRAYVTTTQAAPIAGFPVTFSVDAGVSHDLSFGFLPATTDGNAANGSTGDDYTRNLNTIALHGGYYSAGSAAGLFSLNMANQTDASSPQFCSRLAKV